MTRRLLYFALALVLLALIGLGFVRVTNSAAYVAQARLMRIHLGMSPEQLSEVMDGFVLELRVTDGGLLRDLWTDDRGTTLLVWYDANEQVTGAGVATYEPTMDRLFNLLGYPELIGELPPSSTDIRVLINNRRNKH